MTLWIKNNGYGSLIRLDLMLSMSLWKKFQLLQTLNDLSTKHLIKLILYGNDVKLLKFKNRSIFDIELQHVLKELSISKNVLYKQFSTIASYILKKSRILYNNK